MEQNKAVVIRFNKEVIELRSLTAFHELTTPISPIEPRRPASRRGADGMLHMLNDVLRPALPDLSVEINGQIAEGDKSTKTAARNPRRRAPRHRAERRPSRRAMPSTGA